MKRKFLKAPALSTAFSENKESAKKRFSNIFDEKGKIGIILVVILVVIVTIAGTFISIRNNNNETNNNDNEINNGIKDEDVDKQIGVIVDNVETWKQDELFSHGHNYTITDLDHNGRLEIIEASCQGTGIFTYGNMYEVNEECTGIYKVQDDIVEGESWPDIIVSNVKVFYDAVSDSYKYIFDDFSKNGAAESYASKTSFVVKDGKLNIEYIAHKSVIYDENAVATITCSDKADKEISEEEYENIEDSMFKEMSSKRVSLKWLSHDEVFANDESGDTIKDKLLYSYQNFNIEVTNSQLANAERRKAYVNALNNLYYNNILPDGNEKAYSEGYTIENNRFAIFDIDFDGKEELVLDYHESYTAGQIGAVYEYDVDSNKIVTEFADFPLLTFYNNGVVISLMSHNQGNAGENFWPYLLYNYNKAEDKYDFVAIVDAWDKSFVAETYDGKKFPDDIDKDGDGMVYYVMLDGKYELNTPIDNAEYEEWRKSYIKEDAQEIKVPFVNFTVENIEGQIF